MRHNDHDSGDHQARERPPHVVVVGFGPVASRLLEELLPEARSGALALTVIGAEQRPAYQRIRIGDVSVGRIAPEDLMMDSVQALRHDGVTVHLRTEVTSVDPAARTLTLSATDPGLVGQGPAAPVGQGPAAQGPSSGEFSEDPHPSPSVPETLTYDKLVLATGAEAAVPRMRVELRRGGALDAELRAEGYPEGVMSLRTMEDALRVREVLSAQSPQPVVVLGGGVLGVEAALAVAEIGRPVTLLHRGNVPMGRAVDTDAGMLLRRELTHRGVEVRAATDVTEVVSDDGRLTAVRTSLGERLPAALLITCVGITPRDGLAKAAGLPCSWGITVDQDSRSTGNPDVFAIGDCSSVHGRGTSGLIAPGWLQAEAAAAALRKDLGIVPEVEVDAAGVPVEFAPDPVRPAADGIPEEALAEETSTPEAGEDVGSAGLDVILVKSKTLNMACAGTTDVDPWDPHAPEVSTWSDPKHGQYLRIVTEGERLLGFVSVGMPRTAAELAMHASRGTLPAADRTALLAAEHATKEAELGPEDVLCRCAGTTVGQVAEAAASCCRTVGEISSETRAGTGCGTCHKSIEKILAVSARQDDAHQDVARETARAASVPAPLA